MYLRLKAGCAHRILRKKHEKCEFLTPGTGGHEANIDILCIVVETSQDDLLVWIPFRIEPGKEGRLKAGEVAKPPPSPARLKAEACLMAMVRVAMLRICICRCFGQF